MPQTYISERDLVEIMQTANTIIYNQQDMFDKYNHAEKTSCYVNSNWFHAHQMQFNMSFILLRCLNCTFIIPWLFVSYLVLSLKNDCCMIITLSRSGVWIMKCFLVFLAGFTQGLLRSTAPLSHLFGLTLVLPAAGLCLHPWPM